MKPILLAALFALALPLSLFAQASGFRAQGRYYSAKESFEKGQYDVAAQQLRESREFLGGKTNVRLQYLLVCSLYNAQRFKDAQAEMARFFELEETTGEAHEKIYQNYPQNVDRLTADETREVSIMIDKIDREVANDTEGKAAALRAQEAARAELKAAFEAFRRLRQTTYSSFTWEIRGDMEHCTLTYTDASAPNFVPGKKTYKTTSEFSVFDIKAIDTTTHHEHKITVDKLTIHFSNKVQSKETLYVTQADRSLSSSGSRTWNSSSVWFGIDDPEAAQPVIDRLLKSLRPLQTAR